MTVKNQPETTPTMSSSMTVSHSTGISSVTMSQSSGITDAGDIDGMRSYPCASSCYAVLDGLYALHDELGSGGFGKVRLATHLLTTQKVAIKIIDKNKIKKEDLPRVKTELEALMVLSHQNVCRLYQCIDTPQKFFIVMEYCSGGEMFDYIVKKERLEESEARHFFRQLVQAIAYVHSMGFAHRDLKPENLLLTEDLQLKLIDFGLCARPGHGLQDFLRTCCGSPAYAAPELIQGLPYKGNQVDIWSMGVLLYTLLCGCLPFEDDTVQKLYNRISAGRYYEPSYLSPLSKDLIRALLQVDPEKRITIPELIIHPWVNKKYTQGLKWKSIYDKNVVDEAVIKELANHFERPYAEMEALVKEWKYDYLTATYHLLLKQKGRGMNFTLPMPKPKEGTLDPKQIILGSQTIHASLDTDLNHSGLGENDLLPAEAAAAEKANDVSMENLTLENSEEAKPKMVTTEKSADFSHSPSILQDKNAFVQSSPSAQHDQNVSYAYAMLNMPSTLTGSSPKQRYACGIRDENPPNKVTHPLTPIIPRQISQTMPSRQRTVPQCGVNFESRFYYRAANDKENWRPSTMRVHGPVKVLNDGTKNNVYVTPKRTLRTPKTPKMSSQSVERKSPFSPHTPIKAGTPSYCYAARHPRSTSKTPRLLRHRVFASLERQADKMINLLTPRKVKVSQPEMLNLAKTMVNVSITSSKNPDLVRQELMRVFAEQNISTEQHGWKISGRKKDEYNRLMIVELEVVWIEMGNKEKLVGVKRQRLSGDAFMYKKVCEQVLKLAGL